MWTCPQCQTQNQDTDSACAGCGAVRSAGRFNGSQQASPSARSPRVSTPAAEPKQQQQAQGIVRPSSVRSAYQLPETGVMPRPPRRQAVLLLARFVGTLLAILLPVLTALLAWRQYEAIRQAFLPLLLGADAPAWQTIACYGILALIGVLLAMLPGLWTLLLARRPLPPPRPGKQ